MVWKSRCKRISLLLHLWLVLGIDVLVDTLSITKERLDEISSLVEDWLIRSKCTLKELLGKLHFVCTCLPPDDCLCPRY